MDVRSTAPPSTTSRSSVASHPRLRPKRAFVACGWNCRRPIRIASIFLDGARCRDALTGLLQSLLALAPRGGSLLSVKAEITTIRPALIVECLLHDSDPEPGPEALARFFDPGVAGASSRYQGAVLLGALAHTARAHGGRVDVKAVGKGCLVTFVVPRLDG